MKRFSICATIVSVCVLQAVCTPALFSAPAEVIPHAQDKPPGPPLSPAEAMKKMSLPEGFTVELVASEPDIVNPVAMTFDERGRIWITESLEYPRLEPGPGRDRIKVLEDTNGDGKADKFAVFAEGFNIPSGIAVGYGGVWVANAPDILFLQDTDGDGKADKREVVVSGFGRDDTHELPNSLTWGPDGWLYGLNGVFNQSHVEHRGKQYDFTCALFRIHPRTRDFQLFAEGTSNPWGVAWDGDGSAFVSACVIDHLWHLAETGYYIRQGGPYPPFTSPMGSIVRHKHQKAAYCGIHFFDSDAYPPAYRERLYMGNIHGNGINVDVLSRVGSTYLGTEAPDFLTANDAWFMPVAQKTGPDGCLYILDWYDRYHCYQDARRDAEGIDRSKGRLYRVRYENSPRAAPFDLAAETDVQLIRRLYSPNVFFRDLAQRILCERNDRQTRPQLERLVGEAAAPRKARMHALWTLVGSGSLSLELHQALLVDQDPGFRAWGVRAAGNFGRVDPTVRQKIASMARDPSPEVRLQVAIAAKKIEGLDPLPLLLEVLAASGDDKLIPHIFWQNLSPLLEEQSEQFLRLVAQDDYKKSPAISTMMPRVIDRVLGRSTRDPGPIVALMNFLFDGSGRDPAAMQKCLTALASKLQDREITPQQLVQLRPRLELIVQKILVGSAGDPLYFNAAILATTWKDTQALKAVRSLLLAADQPTERRIQAMAALAAIGDPSLEAVVPPLLTDTKFIPVELRSATLGLVARVDAPWVAKAILTSYQQLEPELRPRAIEVLTERTAWAEQLLDAIGRQEIPATALNVNQVRQLMLGGNATLAAKVRAQWGSIRSERDPKREDVIAQMRTFLRRTPGDAQAGQAIFNRVCGQCHKIYGEGQDVGPDITLNGRSSFEQLLSNVFDPSLVIGAAYQARTIVTVDGRVLTGLLAEESNQRVVLKTQGGKLETIARQDVEEMKASHLSLMPEELEKQLKPQELADLFALLTLDKPPSDPSSKKLPGAQPIVPRETNDPAQFATLVQQLAPGFSTSKAGKAGLAIVEEHLGREGVLRTCPVSRQEPCILRAVVEVPEDKRTRLVLSVSHDPQGAWNLTVNANGNRLHQALVGSKDAAARWQTISLDLTSLAGKKVHLELLNATQSGKFDAAYWGQVEIISE
ncbi:MAG: c-type cytochrome [Planctomycetia bacterium]|nr:c-type cytochrome [Planctomycetia bacterium]